MTRKPTQLAHWHESTESELSSGKEYVVHTRVERRQNPWLLRVEVDALHPLAAGEQLPLGETVSMLASTYNHPIISARASRTFASTFIFGEASGQPGMTGRCRQCKGSGGFVEGTCRF